MRLAFAVPVVGVLVWTACGGSTESSPPPLPFALVNITPYVSTLFIGQSVTLTANPIDFEGKPVSGITFTWSSEDPAVATVSQQGKVTALSVGDAMITATVQGRGGAAWVDVVPGPVASVTLTPSELFLHGGDVAQLTATLRDTSGNVLSGRPVTWLSSPPWVAAVSDQGVVRAGLVGDADIFATCDGVTAKAQVWVTAGPPARLMLSRQAAGAVSGQPFLQPPEIIVQDGGYNLLIFDSTTVVTITISAGASLLGTTTKRASHGIVRFTDVGIIGSAGAIYGLTFTAPGLTPAVQDIRVDAAP